MIFTAPMFLLAALAAAIPIVLHMIQRRPAKQLPFATLRFLRRSAEKTRQRKRFHDSLLMVLRAVVLLFIAAGLARPILRFQGAFGNTSHTAAVILLDNSASMGIADAGGTRFEIAAAAASQVLDQFTDGDQVALMPACGPAFPQAARLDRNQDAARQALSQCRVSYERANLSVSLRQARAMLQKSDLPNKRIYILSDMQQVSWEDEKSSQEQVGQIDVASPLVIVIDCQQAAKANAAVQQVELKSPMPRAGTPLKVLSTVASASQATQQRRVELLIDGVVAASSNDFVLPPDGRASLELTITFRSPGLHHGEVRLVGEDGSKFDDRRFFAVTIDQAVPIAIVKNQRQSPAYLDEAYYLEQALAAAGMVGNGTGATCFSPAELATAHLDPFHVVFCVNVPVFDPETGQKLADYIDRGGNMIWILGDKVDPDVYNRMNRAAKERLLPAPLIDRRNAARQQSRDSWHISFLDKHHRAISNLQEPAWLYESVLIYDHVRCAVDNSGALVLARLDDGEPLLTEKRFGEGRSIMLGTSLQSSASNLSLRPIFLPLITQLTRYLGDKNTDTSITAGQPIVVDYPRQTQPFSIELTPPSGEVLRLRTSPRAAEKGQTFRYPETHNVGIYTLQPLGSPNAPRAISVNVDAHESDPLRLERQQLEKLLQPGSTVFADKADDLTSTFASLREGKSLWSVFLIGVLTVLILETYVANRFTARSSLPNSLRSG